MRVWFNGRIGAFQAFDGGSIPPTRTKLRESPVGPSVETGVRFPLPAQEIKAFEIKFEYSIVFCVIV